MTATEELRRLLDERGVEWGASDTYRLLVTSWNDVSGHSWAFMEHRDGSFSKLTAYHITHEQAIAATLGPKVTGNTSDGYHTFNELYHHRAVLFSVIVRDHRELAWKSMRHHDGTMYDGMFIVGIETPEGQATYHYDIDPYWDMFNCKELDQAPEWDGHTPSEAIERIATLGSCNVGRYVGLRQGEYWERTENSNYYCGGCGWKVTDHDSYCPECGGALHNATLGSCNCSNNCTNGERTETCEADETDTWECVCDDLGGYGKRLTVHVMECTECGHTYEHVNGDYEYCPRCGRKRRDVEE